MISMSMKENITLNGFQDILRERRTTSDFLWASRDWNPSCVYIQPRKSNSSDIRKTVYKSYQLEEVISEISQTNNVSPTLLYRNVEDILKEVRYERVVPVLRWLGFCLVKILKKLCSGVLINEGKFLQIKSQLGRNPVLLVPSHRSYGDFILLSYVCFHYELDIPRIAAGMDFHSMAFMGRILRDSCAFFMRRSFTNDKLYAATFSQYVQTLVTHGDSAIEFFIEGTRSRTAKSLVPKYGFLTMALKPFLTGLVPDITILPVNLSYDRVMEELLFVYELLGVPKPKESTKGFIKSLSILNENYGNVYVQVGEPFSVKDFLGNRIDRSIHNFGPVHLQELTTVESREIVRLAHTIVHRQKNLTILTCFNLIASIINQHIMESCYPLGLDDLVGEVRWLVSIMKNLGATVAVENDVAESVVRHLAIHKSLVSVTPDKRIRLLRIHSRTGLIDQTKTKGHSLSNKTMDVAVPLLMIQYYSNPCAHYLVNLVFILLVIECFKDGLSEGELLDYFRFLRLVFSSEFVLHPDTEGMDFRFAFEFGKTQRTIIQHGGHVLPGENLKLRQFCKNFSACFVQGYLILTEVLLKEKEHVMVEKNILKSYQEAVELSIGRSLPIHPACLSLDLVANALHAFVHIGAVRKFRRDNQTHYEVNPIELEKISAKLRLFDFVQKGPVDASQHFSVFLNGKL